MHEPIWKRLVESLDERGFESRYLDRLMDRLNPVAMQVAMGRGFQALQHELIEEMAYALRRAEDKVNLSLLHIELAAEAIANNDDPNWVDELEDAYETRRLEAMRARWEFSVHREAIGLIGHGVLEDLYPIPPRRRHRSAAAAHSQQTEDHQRQ